MGIIQTRKEMAMEKINEKSNTVNKKIELNIPDANQGNNEKKY